MHARARERKRGDGQRKERERERNGDGGRRRRREEVPVQQGPRRRTFSKEHHRVSLPADACTTTYRRASAAVSGHRASSHRIYIATARRDDRRASRFSRRAPAAAATANPRITYIHTHTVHVHICAHARNTHDARRMNVRTYARTHARRRVATGGSDDDHGGERKEETDPREKRGREGEWSTIRTL